MNGWNLEIILKSDFCTAVGENDPGIINKKTALQYGVPYIPAKRIKGCLLEAGREMADNGVIDYSVLYQLFGSPGREEGTGIHVFDGYLRSVPKYLFDQEQTGKIVIKNQKEFYRAMKVEAEKGESILESILTRTRTRTAIEDEVGTAREHSLRTLQVVPAEVAFSCRIEGNLSPKEEEALLLCVKGLRHMGIGITRGLGEIQCSLEFGKQKEQEEGNREDIVPEACSSNEGICISYELDLDEPMVIAKGTEDCCEQIPASTILGAFAGMYIRKYKLGKDAHKNEDFRRIFLRDNVQFGYGFLKKNGIIYVPCPRTLALLKDKETTWMNTMKDTSQLRRRRMKGQISFVGNELYRAEVEKEIHFHHARPSDRGIGHALNDRAEDTSTPTGQFFQYLALARGQTFEGSIMGSAEDIRKILVCLEENHYRLRLGKSRTAEYGSCTLRVVNKDSIERKEAPSQKGKDWFLWLLTPLIYRNPENGTYVPDTDLFLRQMSEKLGCSVKLEKSSCDYTVLNGYNSKWRLPSVSLPALAEGSTFYIRTGREIDVHELIDQRWGVKTGNGCGQVMAVSWDDISEGEWKTDFVLKSNACVENEEIISMILKRKEDSLEIKKAVTEAVKGLEQNKVKLPQASVIAMFLQIHNDRYGKKEDFYGKMKLAAERISGEEKKECALCFLKACENKSYEFVKIYLENAKWKARKREEQDDETIQKP